jgi:hypothetical protein
MDHGLLHFGLIAFVTLLMVTDPVGVAPIFVALTRGLNRIERRATLAQALIIAFGVMLFFSSPDATCFLISASRYTPSPSAAAFTFDNGFAHAPWPARAVSQTGHV